MKVDFTVYGNPQGKGRPRFARRGSYVHAYTPEKTVAYEEEIQIAYLRQCENYCFGDAPLRLYVTAYYPIPKSTTKEKRMEINAGQCRPTKKPDLDNVVKVVADSLNSIAYKDDAQICVVTIMKHYGDVPRLEIQIEELWEVEKC